MLRLGILIFIPCKLINNKKEQTSIIFFCVKKKSHCDLNDFNKENYLFKEKDKRFPYFLL